MVRELQIGIFQRLDCTIGHLGRDALKTYCICSLRVRCFHPGQIAAKECHPKAPALHSDWPHRHLASWRPFQGTWQQRWKEKSEKHVSGRWCTELYSPRIAARRMHIKVGSWKCSYSMKTRALSLLTSVRSDNCVPSRMCVSVWCNLSHRFAQFLHSWASQYSRLRYVTVSSSALPPARRTL